MKKLILFLLLPLILFAQSGNDRSADFFSQWFDTILMMRDTTIVGVDTTQRVQDGFGYHTPLRMSQTEVEIESDFFAGDSTLFVDSTNKKVGINHLNPDSTLTIGGGLHVTGGFVVDGGYSAGMPTFSVYQQDAGQAGILHGTTTKIVWHNEEWDSHADFATNRFTPSVEGKYLLTASVTWEVGDIDAGDWFSLALYKNGAVVKANLTKFADTNGNYVNSPLPVIVYADGATDYFEIFVYQNIGVTKSTVPSTELSPVSAYTWWQGHGIP